MPQRELRIKVWKDEEAGLPDLELDAPAEQRNSHAAISQDKQREEQAPFPPALPQERAEEDHGVQDLPTTPMPSTLPPGKDVKPFSPAVQHQQPVSVNPQPGKEDREDADLPTRPMVAHLPDLAQANRPSGRPFPAQSYRQAVPPPQSIDQRQQSFSAQVSPIPNQAPIVQRPVTPALPDSYPSLQQALPAPASGGIVAGPSPSRPARRKSKMRVVVMLVMLLVLLGGGLTYLIIAYQPFSVPAVTRTSLSFSNVDLGIALQYPQGWTAQLNAAHQMVSFFDANHIYQVNITVTARNGSSVTGYLNKEVAQLGLTAPKNLSPITFAGTSWQQAQGTVVASGATDRETLLVAIHGDRFYTMTHMAPDVALNGTPVVTYAEADHLFFSMFRASFQFL